MKVEVGPQMDEMVSVMEKGENSPRTVERD